MAKSFLALAVICALLALAFGFSADSQQAATLASAEETRAAAQASVKILDEEDTLLARDALSDDDLSTTTTAANDKPQYDAAFEAELDREAEEFADDLAEKTGEQVAAEEQAAGRADHFDADAQKVQEDRVDEETRKALEAEAKTEAEARADADADEAADKADAEQAKEEQEQRKEQNQDQEEEEEDAEPAEAEEGLVSVQSVSDEDSENLNDWDNVVTGSEQEQEQEQEQDAASAALAAEQDKLAAAIEADQAAGEHDADDTEGVEDSSSDDALVQMLQDTADSLAPPAKRTTRRFVVSLPKQKPARTQRPRGKRPRMPTSFPPLPRNGRFGEWLRRNRRRIAFPEAQVKDAAEFVRLLGEALKVIKKSRALQMEAVKYINAKPAVKKLLEDAFMANLDDLLMLRDDDEEEDELSRQAPPAALVADLHKKLDAAFDFAAEHKEMLDSMVGAVLRAPQVQAAMRKALLRLRRFQRPIRRSPPIIISPPIVTPGPRTEMRDEQEYEQEQEQEQEQQEEQQELQAEEEEEEQEEAPVEMSVEEEQEQLAQMIEDAGSELLVLPGKNAPRRMGFALPRMPAGKQNQGRGGLRRFVRKNRRGMSLARTQTQETAEFMRLLGEVLKAVKANSALQTEAVKYLDTKPAVREQLEKILSAKLSELLLLRDDDTDELSAVGVSEEEVDSLHKKIDALVAYTEEHPAVMQKIVGGVLSSRRVKRAMRNVMGILKRQLTRPSPTPVPTPAVDMPVEPENEPIDVTLPVGPLNPPRDLPSKIRLNRVFGHVLRAANILRTYPQLQAPALAYAMRHKKLAHLLQAIKQSVQDDASLKAPRHVAFLRRLLHALRYVNQELEKYPELGPHLQARIQQDKNLVAILKSFATSA